MQRISNSKKAALIRRVLRILMWLDNLYYKSVSRLAIAAEGGTHPKHRLTKYHQFFIDNVSPTDAILDIGCGDGFLTYDLAKKVRHITAIDINKDNIEFARRNYNQENIKYLYGDATRFNFKERYDAIILSNMLEHIDKRIDFLSKIRKLADTFLIRVPQLNRDWLTYYKIELGVEYRLDPTHKIEYTMASLSQELKQAGMSIKRASIQFGEIWAVAGRLK